MAKKRKSANAAFRFFEETRRSISDRLHFIAMLVAIPACTFSGIRIFTIGFKPLFLLDVLFAVIVTLMYIFRKYINYRIRIIILLFYFFLMGIFSLQTFGLMGLGMLIIFYASVLLTALFGMRYGIVALLISIVSVSIFLFAVYKHWVVFDVSFDAITYDGYHLLTRGIFFASYLFVAIVIIGYINRSFAFAYQRLGISESRLNLAISSVDEVVWDFDLANSNYFVSEKFEEVVRVTLNEDIKSLKGWLLRVHPDDRRMVLEKIRSHLAGNSPVIYVEYRFLDRYGQWQWLLTRAKIAERDAENVPLRVLGTHSNITHYRKLREELVETENRYRTLFLLANDPILIIGKSGFIVDANIRACKIFGYTTDSIVGVRVTELCCRTDGSSDLLAGVFEGDQHKIAENRMELTMLRNKAEPFPVEISIASITDLGQTFHQLVIHDLTLQRRFDREKLNAVVEMEERERQRLASNLHDDVGPLLASLNMYLSLMANHKGNPDELVTNMQEILRDAIASVREISHNLSPYNLITAGLVVAFNRHFQRYTDIIKIHFNQNIDEQRFATAIEVALYRVVKELLNNTIKYANAANVYINLNLENQNLKLEYADDGKGFDFESAIQKSNGIGLTSIVERLSSIKAEYEFYSEPGKGFRFEVIVNTLS